MSYNEDDLEEIEEEAVNEEIKPEPKPEPPQHNLAPVNAKRKLNSKANQVRFLITFANDNKKTLEEIAKEVGVTRNTGAEYLRHYVSIIINSIERGAYPKAALYYYNNELPPAQRLNAGHVEDLRPVVLKYHNDTVESLMHKMGYIKEEEVITEVVEEADPEEEILDDYSSGQFKEYNEVKQKTHNPVLRVLNANSPIQDVIRFGIINCGQPDDSKIRKILAI